MHSYAYLILVLMLGVPWTVFFILRRDLRKEMLWGSCFVSIFGLTELIFYGEYWKPEFLIQFGNYKIGIEDILLCFFYGGISFVLYQVFFAKRHTHKSKVLKRKNFSMPILAVISGLIVYPFLYALGFSNIIYISSIGLCVIGVITIAFRRDLLRGVFLNALLTSLMIFVIMIIWSLIFPGIINEWWELDKLSGIQPLGIPIEELLWYFSLGLAFGGFYELINELRYKNPTARSK
ncbi:MAG: hypothetical protein US52_C0005G0010 [candidate division WS6 bacterium GW2011_GWA2_37_6]|uniref:Lycopene cyclase domain-containing protein n=1 Tax=candidate division WS6 bacterium GW2011_GWA2_37_6 TaxID=1619087 RepID=A0A0G0HCF6_9BACT|nr:MAG: hypothetical protein US52_C0005G0010 [candidate division WS6 bacterium GW2011_GWA2_37_6]